MADGEVIVKTKIVADTSGAKQAEAAVKDLGLQTKEQLDSLKKKSRQLGDEGSKGIGKLQKAVGFLKSALTGFGALTAITGLIAAIGKIRESLGKAREEADEFARAKEKGELKDAVDALAKSYADLGASIQKTSDAAKHANEIQDIAIKNARELENAQLDLAEQKELSAIDGSDPVANEIRATISARYNARRGRLAAQRSRDDIITEYNRLQEEASDKRKAARKIVESTSEDDEAIRKAEKMRVNAFERSTSMNSSDYGNGAAQFGANIKRIVTFEWGSVGDEMSEKGDAIRAQAKEEEKELAAEIARLKKQKEDKLKEAERLRGEAGQLTDRAGAVYGAIKSINVRETATEISNQRGIDAADQAKAESEEREKKRKREQAATDLQHHADKKLIASAPKEEARMQAEADAAQARINDADAARSARLIDIQQRRTLGRISDRAASSEVAAAESDFKQVEAEVGAVLTRLREEMKSFKAELRKAESREQSYKEGA